MVNWTGLCTTLFQHLLGEGGKEGHSEIGIIINPEGPVSFRANPPNGKIGNSCKNQGEKKNSSIKTGWFHHPSERKKK